MGYRLARRAALKWLEIPAVYHIAKDELYELDDDSFGFLQHCLAREGCTSKDSAFIDYCVAEGLLTAEAVSIQQPMPQKSPEPSLRYLELQITDACNLRCKHCYLTHGTRSELSPHQISRLLKELEDMQGLRVLLTGGEPLLHSRFSEINEILPDFFLRKVLFTNGILLTKELLRSLKVDEIQVSIDGLQPGHDLLRGTGTFQRSLEGMRHALDAGFDVSVSTMVHRANLAEFDGMEQLFKDMGIKDWTVDVPCATGSMVEHDKLFVDPETGGKYLGYGYGGGVHTAEHGYGCGLHLMAVMADGKMAKCTFYADRAAGNVDEGLRTAWSRIKPVHLKDLSCDCEFLEVCRGGCRYRAELLDGKNGKDRYRCALYETA